jgi:transcriptional regulator with XRE-family HTH domain
MSDPLIRTAADWIPVFRGRIRELGLTHLEVDARAGLSEGHCGKILCGSRTPTLQTIDRLCRALGISFMPIFEADGRSSFDGESQLSDAVRNQRRYSDVEQA